MGTTKAAVTLIGLRVPIDQIRGEKITTVNGCKCTPQSIVGTFCHKCGMEIFHRVSTAILEDPEYFYEDKEKGGLLTKDHPMITVVGDWRYGDKYLYIACFVSRTTSTYPAEGADPVRVEFNERIYGVQNIFPFQHAMKLHGLWNKDAFGLWTILLLA